MENGDSNSTESKRVLRGPALVAEGTAAARRFAAVHRLVKEDTARLCILVEELLANLVDHGGVGPDDPVEQVLALSGRQVHLTVTDNGRPFDPRLARDSHGDDRASPAGAGAGLRLLDAWATVKSYESSAGRNRLSLVIPFRRTATKG